MLAALPQDQDRIVLPAHRRLKVRVKESPEAATIEEFELAAGECMDVPIGLVHQMEAIEDAELFEFSTQHFDSDSHRLGARRLTNRTETEELCATGAANYAAPFSYSAGRYVFAPLLAWYIL